MWRTPVCIVLPGEEDRRREEGGWKISEPDITVMCMCACVCVCVSVSQSVHWLMFQVKSSFVFSACQSALMLLFDFDGAIN